MKIVQTFWSNNVDPFTNSFGWLAPEYHLMSWTLSCLQIKQHYNDVTLYCDSLAAKILIDILQLPYSELVCNLDDFNKYDAGLWALPKIHTYSLQESPFLHIDGDVFIWKKFDAYLINGDLIAQNEDEMPVFEQTMQSLEANFSYFPKEISSERILGAKVTTFNAGIYGGSDISFFKEYTHESFKFVHENTPHFSKINVSNFNAIFEQYLFYCFVKKKNKKVQLLFNELIRDKEYKGFGDFDCVPHQKQYLHLLSDYKKSGIVCNDMAFRLRQDYPENYYKIIELFKKKKLPLFNNYFFFKKEEEGWLIEHEKILLIKLHIRSQKINLLKISK
jgi:hypothetical protein